MDSSFTSDIPSVPAQPLNMYSLNLPNVEDIKLSPQDIQDISEYSQSLPPSSPMRKTMESMMGESQFSTWGAGNSMSDANMVEDMTDFSPPVMTPTKPAMSPSAKNITVIPSPSPTRSAFPMSSPVPKSVSSLRTPTTAVPGSSYMSPTPSKYNTPLKLGNPSNWDSTLDGDILPSSVVPSSPADLERRMALDNRSKSWTSPMAMKSPETMKSPTAMTSPQTMKSPMTNRGLTPVAVTAMNSPKSPAKTPTRSYAEVLQKHNLELVSTIQHTKQGPVYVIAKTPSGNSAWIKMDKEEYLANIDNPTYLMNSSATVVSDAEIRAIAQACIEEEKCSLVVECENGVCALEAVKDEYTPEMESFGLYDKEGKSYTPTGMAIISPRYNISELENAIQSKNEEIDRLASKINSKTSAHLDAQFNKLQQQVERLRNETAKTKDILTKIHKLNNRDIELLNKRLAMAKDTTTYKTLLKNIVNKRELENNIINEFYNTLHHYDKMGSSSKLSTLIQQFERQIGMMAE